jgi:hypothetical protein
MTLVRVSVVERLHPLSRSGAGTGPPGPVFFPDRLLTRVGGAVGQGFVRRKHSLYPGQVMGIGRS